MTLKEASRQPAIYRMWTPYWSFAQNKRPSHELTMIPGNTLVRLPRNIATEKISEYFFAALRRALPEDQVKAAEIEFMQAGNSNMIVMRVPAKLPNQSESRLMDQISAEVLDGMTKGTFLRA